MAKIDYVYTKKQKEQYDFIIKKIIESSRNEQGDLSLEACTHIDQIRVLLGKCISGL